MWLLLVGKECLLSILLTAAAVGTGLIYRQVVGETPRSFTQQTSTKCSILTLRS